MPVKILGREPVAWLSLIEGALALLVVFQLGVDQERAIQIMAVATALFGVIAAWLTKDTMLGVMVGLAKSVLVLAIGFGLSLTDAQTAGIIAFVTIAVGFWFHRDRTTPADTVLTHA
jgi:hypothetical protein